MESFDRTAFQAALPVTCELGGERFILAPKTFSTGSSGWHGNRKLKVQGWDVQANILLTIVYSKPGSGPKKKTPEEGEVPTPPSEVNPPSALPAPENTEPVTPQDLFKEKPPEVPTEAPPKKRKSK